MAIAQVGHGKTNMVIKILPWREIDNLFCSSRYLKEHFSYAALYLKRIFTQVYLQHGGSPKILIKRSWNPFSKKIWVSPFSSFPTKIQRIEYIVKIGHDTMMLHSFIIHLL